jgi:uncharacterized DUF497 family protein
MNFEWDAKKAASNQRKHAVLFSMAARVFGDPQRIEWPDEAHGESRWNTVGLVDGVELVVVYTIRLEIVRLISARKATRYEREIYWNG